MNRTNPATRPILQPGINCWRLAHAHRVACLIDGAAYFAALRAALAKARRREDLNIYLLDWDFNMLYALRAYGLRRWLKRNGRPIAAKAA